MSWKTSEDAREFVYVLTNAAMPGLVKMGRTRGPVEERVRQLNSATGVLAPFEIYCVARVRDSVAVERAMHVRFAHCRVNSGREFFRMTPGMVRGALLGIARSTAAGGWPYWDGRGEKSSLAPFYL